MKKKNIQQNKSAPTVKYALLARKNLGSSAWYKDGAAPRHLKDVNDYDYIRNWIFENGDKDNVYFVEGLGNEKCSDKWVHDSKLGWHKTKFRTSSDPRNDPQLADRKKGTQSYMNPKPIPTAYYKCDCGFDPNIGS